MSRKQIVILAASISVILLIIIGVALAISGNSESPADPSSSESIEGLDAHDHDESAADHEHGDEITIGGRQVEPDYVIDEVMPIARQATLEFVRQSTSESNSQRRDRLAPHFTPTSPALTASKPSVDKTYSPNTNSNPIVIGEQWEFKDGAIVATIFLEVITINQEEPYNELSRIYQGYDVTIASYQDSYRAQDIKFSDKPIIRRR